MGRVVLLILRFPVVPSERSLGRRAIRKDNPFGMADDISSIGVDRFDESIGGIRAFHIQETLHALDTAGFFMVIGKNGVDVWLLISKSVRSDPKDSVEFFLVTEFHNDSHCACRCYGGACLNGERGTRNLARSFEG